MYPLYRFHAFETILSHSIRYILNRLIQNIDTNSFAVETGRFEISVLRDVQPNSITDFRLYPCPAFKLVLIIQETYLHLQIGEDLDEPKI